jgi:probable rRNA maturation factor
MPKGKVLVELDRTDDWDRDTDWDAIAVKAIDAAFAVVDFVTEGRISISINLSDNDEVQALNAQWRGKDKPTNVLSFPMLDGDELEALLSPLPFRGGAGGGVCQSSSAFADKPHPNPVEPLGSVRGTDPSTPEGEGLEVLLGDLILAYTVCATEAEEKQIPLTQHVTHLIIHGTLHLLGYDHIDDTEAEAMEALEVKALASLGLPNPY